MALNDNIKDDALVDGAQTQAAFKPSQAMLDRAKKSIEAGMDVWSRGLRQGENPMLKFLKEAGMEPNVPQQVTPEQPTTTAPLVPDSSIQTTPEQPIVDMVQPSLDPAMQAQNTINQLGNIPMSQMTPQQMQDLRTAMNFAAEQEARDTLTGIYDPRIQQASALEAERQAQFETGRQSELARQEEEIARSRELLAQTFAPRFAQLERAGERALSDIQTGFSFRGTGRGTAAQEKRAEQMEATAMQERALAAEQALQERLLVAQIKGESEEVIKGLSEQLDSARTARQDLEAEAAQKQADLTATLGTLGQESITGVLKSLQMQAQMNEYDPNLSAATGKIVDSSGRELLGPDGLPLQPAQGVPEADEEISKLLGVLVDSSGRAITDIEGNQININKPVKGTFQDGAKNTYILFEDGSTQQIGARGGVSGGAGAAGFNPGKAAVYNEIGQIALTEGIGFAEAAEMVGHPSKNIERLAAEADAYFQSLPTPEAAPAQDFTREGGLVDISPFGGRTFGQLGSEFFGHLLDAPGKTLIDPIFGTRTQQ